MMATLCRLKREECRHTKHDSVFSKWEILIGPSDWDDHSLGKEGVQRYRIHNLPNSSSCPGLYELGVIASPNEGGRKSLKHDSEDIVVVYLGQADNVRTRLQQYGRFGGHLDRGNLIPSNERPGLFREIFSRSYSIIFRWAPMLDKKEAEKKEAELLRCFDYAWNKVGNGACRRDEILRKLGSKASRRVHIFPSKLKVWKHPIFAEKAGITIDSSVPIDEQKGLFLPKVFKTGKFQLRFVHGNNDVSEHEICGVALGDGSVCRETPNLGRKRCEKHKGKKILGNSSVETSGVVVSQDTTITCGVVLEDGSVCAEMPTHGRKRCELHKGRRVANRSSAFSPYIGLLPLLDGFGKCRPQSVQGPAKKEEEGFDICGVINYDGSICRNAPVPGRKRCEGHKGRRVTETASEPRVARESVGAEEGDACICGAVSDGYVCRARPVTGRKRCEEHKGQRITSMTSTKNVKGYASSYASEEDELCVCGAGLANGSRCRKLPVPGRKRCALHKGRRAA